MSEAHRPGNERGIPPAPGGGSTRVVSWDDQDLHEFTFFDDVSCPPPVSAFVLPVGATVIVTSGDTPIHSPPGRIAGWCNDVWNNDGDSARLFDDDGRLVSQVIGSPTQCR